MRLFWRMGVPRVAARLSAALLPAILLLTVSVFPAAAGLLIEIDKSSQRMIVSVDGEQVHVWPVSTGLPRYDTPSGEFKPFRMERDHFSREWDDAPMPHSIFFTKRGHAIHGTDHARAIGRPASHGCVRLGRENARELFEMVRREGMANTRVVLTGEAPDPRAPAMVRRAPDDRDFYREGERRRIEPRPAYRERPGYIFGDRPGDDDVTSSVPRGRPEADAGRDVRTGYWTLRPDGSRVFVDRERAGPPAPFFPGRPPHWD